MKICELLPQPARKPKLKTITINNRNTFLLFNRPSPYYRLPIISAVPILAFPILTFPLPDMKTQCNKSILRNNSNPKNKSAFKISQLLDLAY